MAFHVSGYQFPFSYRTEKYPSRLGCQKSSVWNACLFVMDDCLPALGLPFKLPLLEQAFPGRPAKSPHSPPQNYSTILEKRRD